MGAFTDALTHASPAENKGRRWFYIPYDQLTDAIGPLSRTDPHDAGIVLVESPWKAGRRPYHQQKLALVLANMRQFALEQARRGVAVDYRVSKGPYREALASAVQEHGVLTAMAPAERELRADIAPLVADGRIEAVPHEGWLTTTEDFITGAGETPTWRMDAFYRRVRRRTGILMDERNKPLGGRFSFDGDNRKPWKGDPPAPTPPHFEPDAITQEVIQLVRTHFAHHPGRVRPEQLPTTSADAERLWTWALSECLPIFGPYEDAMSTRSRGLFHTRISPLMNLHRLLPRRVLDDVLATETPLASLEGFVRQVIGWREYVRHVHVATDGFRRLPDGLTECANTPGDGGFSAWRGTRFGTGDADAPMDGGALPNRQAQHTPVPPAFWGQPSGMHCLDDVIEAVWDEGYSHHITRLMVLSNLGMLLDLSPRDLTDWFWVAYIDAYDWVVEPNVLGMGLYATDVMTTKPYIAGSGYVSRMSDYCKPCAFDPKKSCPLTPMYWAWLARHGDAVSHLQRMRMPLATLRKRSDMKRRHDRAVFEHVVERLAAGHPLRPDDIPALEG